MIDKERCSKDNPLLLIWRYSNLWISVGAMNAMLCSGAIRKAFGVLWMSHVLLVVPSTESGASHRGRTEWVTCGTTAECRQHSPGGVTGGHSLAGLLQGHPITGANQPQRGGWDPDSVHANAGRVRQVRKVRATNFKVSLLCNLQICLETFNKSQQMFIWFSFHPEPCLLFWLLYRLFFFLM